MGNCTTKPSAVRTNMHRSHAKGTNRGLPGMWYLYREQKCLLRLEGSSVQRFGFDSKAKIRPDSAVGFLSDSRIMVAGGTASGMLLTKEVFIVCPKTQTVIKMASLPVATKEGNLLEYNGWVYFVGGLTDTNDEEDMASEVPTPLLRYALATDQWEIFKTNKEKHQKYEVNVLMHNSVTHSVPFHEDHGDSERTIELSELIHSGTLLFNGKIYFIGSQRFNSSRVERATKKIYSLDLQTLVFHREAFKFPIKVVKPLCISGKTSALVAGGFDAHNQGSTSLQAYILMFKDPPEFHRMDSLPCNITGNYPGIHSANHTFIFSQQKISMLTRQGNTNSWSTFNIDKFHNSPEQKQVTFSFQESKKKLDATEKEHLFATRLTMRQEEKKELKEATPEESSRQKRRKEVRATAQEVRGDMLARVAATRGFSMRMDAVELGSSSSDSGFSRESSNSSSSSEEVPQKEGVTRGKPQTQPRESPNKEGATKGKPKEKLQLTQEESRGVAITRGEPKPQKSVPPKQETPAKPKAQPIAIETPLQSSVEIRSSYRINSSAKKSVDSSSGTKRSSVAIIQTKQGNIEIKQIHSSVSSNSQGLDSNPPKVASGAKKSGSIPELPSNQSIHKSHTPKDPEHPTPRSSAQGSKMKSKPIVRPPQTNGPTEAPKFRPSARSSGPSSSSEESEKNSARPKLRVPEVPSEKELVAKQRVHRVEHPGSSSSSDEREELKLKAPKDGLEGKGHGQLVRHRRGGASESCSSSSQKKVLVTGIEKLRIPEDSTEQRGPVGVKPKTLSSNHLKEPTWNVDAPRTQAPEVQFSFSESSSSIN